MCHFIATLFSEQSVYVKNQDFFNFRISFGELEYFQVKEAKMNVKITELIGNTRRYVVLENAFL